MNKKQKVLPFLLALTPLVTLMSSCGYNNYFQFEEEDITNSDVVRTGSQYGNYCPSEGDVKVLVVPVKFTDFEIEETYGKSEEEAKQDIYNAYFGDPEDTSWHSLSSYYYESSYGKLNFTGVVLDWQYAYDTTDWERQTPTTATEFGLASTAAGFAQNLHTDIVNYLWETVVDEDGNPVYSSGTEMLKDFDSDGDGSIDMIELVYSAPIQYEGENEELEDSFYWAYCGSTGSSGSSSAPTIGKWAWLSYETLFEAGYYDEDNNFHDWTKEQIASGEAVVDAHTIIHETGHGLSLSDYYDTSYSNVTPLGRVDMMDYNVGDHNSYSKAILGWIDPYVVDGNAEITIKSFTETGDAIFVPYRGYFDDADPSYANTYFTEYIAIEFYTPTGLNEHDSQYSYAGNYATCPTDYGIKLIHVDSRLGVFNYSSTTGSLRFSNYTDRIYSGDTVYTKVATTNTRTETINTDEYFLSLLPNGGRTSYALTFTNASLYKEGDVFGSAESGYENFQFHTEDDDGSKVDFGYTIEVVSLSEEEATIRIKKA